MGSEKARLPFRGTSLIGYVATEVEAATGSVTIVGGGVRPGWRTIPDAVPGFGPVAGIAAALDDSVAEWTLIVACDMPHVSRAWLRQLLDRADGQVLAPRTADGQTHPLCAVWHSSARQAMSEAVAGGVHTVREAIGRLDCRWFELDDARPVLNVNTPDEWARVRE